MGKYSFSIQDYHAIKEAFIEIDGLTVLAGINGSGKSTLSRCLYYLINAMHEFEHIQKRRFVNTLAREASMVARVLRPDSMSLRYENYRDRMLAYREDNKFDAVKLSDLFIAFVLQAENDLEKYVEEASPAIIKRLSFYLAGQEGGRDAGIENVIQTYVDKCYSLLQTELDNLNNTLSSRALLNLEDVIQNEFEQYEGLPNHISFAEEGYDLFNNGSFTPPLALNRAIYVDSPMVLSENDYDENSLWGRFRNLLYTTNNSAIQHDERIQSSIQRIIGGRVKLVEDDIGYSQEMHYLANDGTDIRIEETATGIKSFAYLSRLLENGWLDKETLLLIDEPEAHLHPQWIVEFARLLVLIHKELGTKIMIASHNPDMVAAIQSIAAKEEVLDRTKFYLAEREKDSVQYNFADKGSEIGDIFESFNIAMSRIEQYGTALI